MSKLTNKDDTVLYMLEELSGFESSDIDCNDFDIMVNDDQFTTVSIVDTARLAVGLIYRLVEERKLLRDALIVSNERLLAVFNNTGSLGAKAQHESNAELIRKIGGEI
jgi:hypothetical protein